MLRFISFSNLLSYFSLFAAFLAVHFAYGQDLHLTAAMWAVSALFDNFDGSFAALFQRDETAKQFGRELDSLIDCIAFAVIPVVCLRLLAFPAELGLQIAFVVASFLFVLSAVTRLGYFNILRREGEKGFTGLPTTESALLLATCLLFPLPPDIIWTPLIILAVFMLLPIKIPTPKGLAKILLLVWLVAVVVLHLVLHIMKARI